MSFTSVRLLIDSLMEEVKLVVIEKYECEYRDEPIIKARSGVLDCQV